MKTINVQEAKTQLSRLMEAAAAGETIILGKHGKPMVKLTAYQPEKERRRLGGLEGSIWIDPDFDAEDPRINALFSGGDR
jgi:prevent-host-death family protein